MECSAQAEIERGDDVFCGVGCVAALSGELYH